MNGLITQRSQVQILPRHKVKPQVRALFLLRSSALVSVLMRSHLPLCVPDASQMATPTAFGVASRWDSPGSGGTGYTDAGTASANP